MQKAAFALVLTLFAVPTMSLAQTGTAGVTGEGIGGNTVQPRSHTSASTVSPTAPPAAATAVGSQRRPTNAGQGPVQQVTPATQ